MKRPRIYLVFIALLLFALACEMPALPMDEDTFNTAVAETVRVGLTRNYVSPTFTPTATITFTPMFTDVPPTETPTFTPPPTVTPSLFFLPFVTETSPPLENKIIVTVNTNCRTGPDKSFRVEGTLMRGETTTVHGVDPTHQYWYIRNPDPGVTYCWLSGKYAMVHGDLSVLPVMTPMSTPTSSPTVTPAPGFNAIFYKLETCGDWWLNLELVNNGDAVFKSVLIELTDTFKGVSFSTGANGFEYSEGCNTSSTVEDTLEPGVSVIVSSPSLKTNPTGRKLIVKVSVCTELDGAGACLSKTLTFKPK